MGIKRYSIKEVIEYAFRRFLGIECYKVHYLAMRINEEGLKQRLGTIDFNVQTLEYQDFLKGDRRVFTGGKLELYKERFKDPNYIAYGIFDGDRLVYSTWLSLHRLGLPIECNPVYLSNNEGYLEDSYCDPIARGRGYHSKMNLYRLIKLAEFKKDIAIVTVKDGNIPALKVQAKSGMQDLGCFFIGRLFGLRFSTLKKDAFDKRLLIQL